MSGKSHSGRQLMASHSPLVVKNQRAVSISYAQLLCPLTQGGPQPRAQLPQLRQVCPHRCAEPFSQAIPHLKLTAEKSHCSHSGLTPAWASASASDVAQSRATSPVSVLPAFCLSTAFHDRGFLVVVLVACRPAILRTAEELLRGLAAGPFWECLRFRQAGAGSWDPGTTLSDWGGERGAGSRAGLEPSWESQQKCGEAQGSLSKTEREPASGVWEFGVLQAGEAAGVK